MKAELEYCRKKWALARALNNESEEQCKQLRHEFTMRKIQDQNSAESGYSDEHPSDADGDDDLPGPSKKIAKVPKFDENLVMFDRTASPTYSERRRSESPLIRDFSAFCLFSRAQSEPPRIPAPLIDEADEGDYESFEVLDLIPDPIEERCVASSNEEPKCIEENRLLVTPPPEVLIHSPPKLRAQMRKHKKEKRRKLNTQSKTESAEDMFNRLMAGGHSECSTCSSTTSSSFIDEDIEEIQEIPMDEGPAPIEEHCEISLESTCESVAVVEPEPTPEPPAPAPKDDISILTTKEQEYLQRREERLQRLEAEAKAFYDKMTRNKAKGLELNNHINDIHNTFLERNKERKKSEDEKSEEPQPSTSGESSKKIEKAEKSEDKPNDDEK